MSLLIAFLLWAALVAEHDLATAIEVPIEYRNFPKNLDVSSGMVNRVNILVRGPSGKMDGEDLKNIAVIVDLGGVKRPGEFTFNLDKETIRIPTGLGLQRTVPSQIRMRFEERYARDVPVRIRYAGSVPAGYRLVRQEVSPEVLRVVGPKSRVEKIEWVETDPIDLTGLLPQEVDLKLGTFVEDPQLRIDGNSMVRVYLVMEPARSRER
jgi:YbbR domain-containing protein